MQSDLLHIECFEMEIEHDFLETKLSEIIKNKKGYAYFTAK